MSYKNKADLNPEFKQEFQLMKNKIFFWEFEKGSIHSYDVNFDNFFVQDSIYETHKETEYIVFKTKDSNLYIPYISFKCSFIRKKIDPFELVGIHTMKFKKNKKGYFELIEVI